MNIDKQEKRQPIVKLNKNESLKYSLLNSDFRLIEDEDLQVEREDRSPL